MTMSAEHNQSFKVLPDLEPFLIPVTSIWPDPKNTNKHSDFDLGEIKKSLIAYGQVRAILVSDEGWIIAGNGTYQAALQLGWKQIAAIRATGMDDNLARQYGTVDNKTTRNSVFDDKALSDFAKSLRIDNPSFTLPGFTVDEFTKIANKEFKLPGSPTIVNTPSPDPVYGTSWPERAKFGDVFSVGEGRHRIMAGDVMRPEHLSALMQGDRANMVWSDPPYGVDFESNHYKDGNPHGKILNDNVILDFVPSLDKYTADNCAYYICACHQNQEHWKILLSKSGLMYKNTIIWVKNNWGMGDLKGAYANQYEVIFYYVKGDVELEGERDRDVWNVDKVKPQGLKHATQKPTQLISRALKNTSKVDDIILDPFGGSMPSLFACEETERQARIMELDINHVNRALDAWASQYDEPELLYSV
jgi:DNA modification methylase